MGCDIHSYIEKKDDSGKFRRVPVLEPFENRCYRIFGFLADVRNYSAVPPIAERRGFPDDASAEVKDEYKSWSGDAHSASWLSLQELLAFNYDAEMEDRRVTRQTGPNSWDGGCTAEPGGGQKMTYREFLGEGFFKDLDAMKDVGGDRVVFWFDN